MLHVVTGPFFPSLESAFVHDLVSLKTADPEARVAVLVPSEQLRRYLTRLLVLKHGLALFNVHVLSFHQLALHLDRERRATVEADRAGGQLDLVSDLFFEHLLRHLAQRNLPYTAALHLENLPKGAWSALWASLRDLKDALVDPGQALRAAEEGTFGTEDTDKLKGLFALLAALREGRRALQVGSPDDLAALVTEFVPTSPFLGGLSRIWYYGSYDLTQTQLSLLEALGKRLSVTMYLPQGASQAYGFAQRFLERHLHPLMATSSRLVPGAPASGSGDPTMPVSVVTMNAAGADDELTLVCKQILTLVETNGYRFDEIAVVGRTLTPYQGSLRRIFDQHRIPFISSATMPLLQEPVVKTLLQAAQLKFNGFYRPSVLDVVASPWYRMSGASDPTDEPRPDLWRIAVLALGITRGEDEWRRLARWGAVESWGADGREPGTEMASAVWIEPAQLSLLWARVEGLLEDVARLPAEGGYAELTDTYLSFIERHLSVPELRAMSGGASGSMEDESKLGQALRGVFSQLRDLDRLDATVTWEAWADTFADLLERTGMPLAPAEFGGVEVLDAMAARGLGFRALFVIGLNEKLFPRFIHEDGFLRDRHRHVLEETLGYKLDQKLHGYAEEALLFELLRSSARERLYLSYQRVDAEGRLLAPSAYLDDGHVPGLKAGQAPDLSLPRRWADRARLALFVPPLLTREELTVAMVLEGHDVSTLLTAVGRDGELFAHGAVAQTFMESDQHRLGSHDGLLDGASTHWARVLERGLSPTALETYARCPFQYFAGNLLRLESVRQLPAPELPPPALGLLCHESLRFCYGNLIKQGWPMKVFDASVLQAVVTEAVGQAFDHYAVNHGTGYALTWRLARERVARVVAATLRADEEEARDSGALPVAFEVDAVGCLPDGITHGAVPIRGRWDRVDRLGSDGALRVIDYKYRPGSELKAEDRNLLQAAVRGKRLQPAFYALMEASPQSGAVSSGLPDQVEFVYLLPEGDPVIERTGFARTAWSGPSGDRLRRSIQALVEGVRTEQFFILPDGYCAHCEFATACRRAHQPTWWRSYRSPEARALRLLRRTRLDRD